MYKIKTSETAVQLQCANIYMQLSHYIFRIYAYIFFLFDPLNVSLVLVFLVLLPKTKTKKIMSTQQRVQCELTECNMKEQT